MQDSWPSAQPEREAERGSPLPRVEDLPVVERGYDPDRVREAFDAFYRHLARLDATLRTIEAVEVFRDQAAELRKELRALRTAGWTQQPWLPSYSSSEQVRVGLPEAVFRWAAEACLVIAAPVGAYAADLRPLWIVVATAGAFVIVALSEWISWREQPLVPARAVAVPPPAPPAEEAAPEPVPLPEPEPVEQPAAEATEWALPRAEEPEPVEPEAEEELTAIAPGAETPREAEAEAEPVDEPAAEAVAVPLPPVEPVVEPDPSAAAEAEVEPAVEPVAEAVPLPAAEAEPVPAAEEEVAPVEPEPQRRRFWGRREKEQEEPEPVAQAEPEPEPEPEPELPAVEEAPAPVELRRRFWGRRRREEEEHEARPEEFAPKHVRVLPADEVPGAQVRIDPWEEELDAEEGAEPEPTHPRGAG